MSRMSPDIRRNTILRIQGLERQATNDALALDGARTMLRACLLNVARCEWDAAFHAGTERAERLEKNLPSYRTQVAVYYDRVRRLEESVGVLLREARDLQLKVDLDGPFYLRAGEPSGLWILLRLCWRGWRNSRALQ